MSHSSRSTPHLAVSPQNSSNSAAVRAAVTGFSSPGGHRRVSSFRIVRKKENTAETSPSRLRARADSGAGRSIKNRAKSPNPGKSSASNKMNKDLSGSLSLLQLTDEDSSRGFQRTRSRSFIDKPHGILLQASWAKIGKHGSSGIGSMIFKRIFAKSPKIKEVFGWQHIATNSLIYNESFSNHADVFVDVIDHSIKNIDNLDSEVLPELVRMGKIHAQFQDRGFKPQYWDIFAEAMTDSAIEWTGFGGRHRETIKAWTMLVSYIIDKMRFGYDLEIRRRKAANGYGSYGYGPQSAGSSTSTASEGFGE